MMVFQCFEACLQVFFSYCTGRESLKREVPTEVDFGFAFNDIIFSDRVLRLEIIPSGSTTDPEADTHFKVKTLQICSTILAAKSPFFYKLFKNGMRESQQRTDFTVRINASEEAALMDLLNFMYAKPLSATSESELVDVLMVADKFEVTLCIPYCIELLLALPMSLESALYYLELQSCVPVGKLVKPLIEAAKKHLVDHYTDFTKAKQKEALSLPLSALEFVLGIDGLRVQSEDVVLVFILTWARAHYPNLEDRREILSKLLRRFIMLEYMSCSMLKKVVKWADFECEQVIKRVMAALFSKLEDNYGEHINSHKIPKRVYSLRLIKVVPLEHSQPRCAVYLNLKKRECVDLLLSQQKIYSEHIKLDGLDFFLTAKCTNEQRSNFRNFGLYVGTVGTKFCSVGFEFAVMKKPLMEFCILFAKNKLSITDSYCESGTRKLLSWNDIMSDDDSVFYRRYIAYSCLSYIQLMNPNLESGSVFEGWTVACLTLRSSSLCCF